MKTVKIILADGDSFTTRFITFARCLLIVTIINIIFEQLNFMLVKYYKSY